MVESICLGFFLMATSSYENLYSMTRRESVFMSARLEVILYLLVTYIVAIECTFSIFVYVPRKERIPN